MKSRKDSKDVHAEENLFELPRSITKALKQCVTKHAPEALDDVESVRYLWIYFSADNRRSHSNGQEKELDGEEWLSVLDEAASVGVECVLACTTAPLAEHPQLQALCEWAQETHDMRVGVFVYEGRLSGADLKQLEELDKTKTCLFLRDDSGEDAQRASEHGIHVCSASVTAEDHTPPCDLPQDLICVGPEGGLYTCGLVIGNEQFKLGNALETPLRRVVGDNDLPHTIPPDAPWHEHGCDACPPIMAKRVMQFGDSGESAS